MRPKSISKPAVVLNMFYTGLGIARSLGSRGVRVIGLTAKRRIYGNYTRYADIRRCPDSREAPAELLAFLLRLARELGDTAVLFPTRDDDALFLDRYRSELEGHFIPVLPPAAALHRSLDKWETYQLAREAGVPAPRCAVVESEEDLHRVLADFPLPCVLKPISSHQWRKANHWQLVGARKAIGIFSREELLSQYRSVARADNRVLLQEMVAGADGQLLIAAVYMDRYANCAAAFTAQKLLQVPDNFGTGCIVQTVDRPEILPPTVRLLKAMRFSGIAEVEYKWDSRTNEFKLIEINPRPWDQHRLGHNCGTDLIHFAYCEHAGLPLPRAGKPSVGAKWIAEDSFLTTVLQAVWKRDRSLRALFRLIRGKRIYAIGSLRDPLPLLAYTPVFLTATAGTALRSLAAACSRGLTLHSRRKEQAIYEDRYQDASTKS